MRKISTLLLIIIGSYQSYVKKSIKYRGRSGRGTGQRLAEAVAISCRPLIENGSIEPRYVDAIITRTTLSVRTMWLALVLRCLMRARKRGLTSCH